MHSSFKGISFFLPIITMLSCWVNKVSDPNKRDRYEIKAKKLALYSFPYVVDQEKGVHGSIAKVVSVLCGDWPD